MGNESSNVLVASKGDVHVAGVGTTLPVDIAQVFPGLSATVTTLALSAAADDIVDTVAAHGFVAGDSVKFSGLVGGAGLTNGQTYYVLAASLAALTFKVSATPGGALVDFTTDITAGTVAATGLRSPWKHLGYIGDDGAGFSDSKDVNSIGAWQSFYSVRENITGKESNITFPLREWKTDTLKLAFGGGTVVTTANGSRYSPPKPEDGVDDRSLVLSWRDGAKYYAIVTPRGMVSEGVDTNLNKTDASDLPITFKAMAADDDEDPWYLLTNDPAIV